MGDDITDFILKELPVGVMVFDAGLNVIDINRAAINFRGRHELPESVLGILRRIFYALKNDRFEEFFPGEIYLTERIAKSHNALMFKFVVRVASAPLVTVFITEESLASGMDLNRIRQQRSLTRRETDIIRRVLNGLKNAQIGEELDIAEQTVKDHLSRIYTKFKVRNRFELLSLLMENFLPK